MKIWHMLVLDAEGCVDGSASVSLDYEGPMVECKGGGATTTVQQADPWIGQQPYLRQIFQEAARQYRTTGPDYYPGATVALPSQATNLALALTQRRALSGNPLMQQASQAIGQTLSGQMLGANPYLESAIQAANRPVIDQFRQEILPALNSQFARSGRYGSGAMVASQQRALDQLGRNLSETASGLAYQDYSAERRNQLNAALAAPNLAQQDYVDLERLAAVGLAKDQQAQAALDDAVARYNYQQNLPRQKLAEYLALIQGNYGGSTSTVSRAPQTSPLVTGLGGAAAGAKIGSILFPGVGTAVGAGLGGLLGLL
jgi:hypothetical protein